MNKFLERYNNLKLQIELVPSSSWCFNVRSSITRSQWDLIRKQVYIKANYICEICGGKGSRHPVECHEVWEYDEINHIQKLSYFQALCPKCYEVKHIGLAILKGFKNRVEKTFCTINNVNFIEYNQIIEAVLDQWKRRSNEKWTLDLTHLKEYGINLLSIKVRQE